ncbi:universal stress protein [Nocardioides panacihumi]|uniref:Universal stress protein n=2 Tax=Nocardioides panacihumi TaxID=400774 RepID=A0ABN2RTG2_9ACTN
MTHGWVLVGVDGGEAGEAAVEFAARYAAPRGLRLELLHVAPEPAYAASDSAHARIGRQQRHQLLDTAAARARELLGADDPGRVGAEIAYGGRVDRLLAAAEEGCELVVLGDQRRPQVDRLATGSVLAGVAARCTVPVIGVPAGWTPHAQDPVVVAAVKTCADSGVLLDLASAVAAEHGARLRVLQARDVQHAAPGHRGAWEEAARADLARLVATHCDRYPDLKVDVDVVSGQPARVIANASAQADLLLLTRRPLVYSHGHLGGTGRAVLRESRCPVAVLPPPTAGPGSGP